MDHWMFHCKEVTRKVSESMDHNLPMRQRFLLRMHLLMCKYCTRFRRQLQIIRNASRLDDLPINAIDISQTLSAEAKFRMKSTLKQAAE